MSGEIKKPKHGGRREGAGRKPGVVNAAKRDIAERAKTHGDNALRVLVEVMNDAEAPHAARISAANALLDRGHGRPFQAVGLTDGDGGPLQVVIRDMSRGA